MRPTWDNDVLGKNDDPPILQCGFWGLRLAITCAAGGFLPVPVSSPLFATLRYRPAQGFDGHRRRGTGLPQATCALRPPSPQAQGATARQDQAQSGTTATLVGSVPKAKACWPRKLSQHALSSSSMRRRQSSQTTSLRRRRAKPRSPPQARIRPGRPAPTIGPGTGREQWHPPARCCQFDR